MFKLKIKNKKSKQQTHGGEFSTVEEYQEWINSCEAVEAWGKPETTETILVSEAIPEVRDDEGNIVQEAVEAVYETVITPAEYEIEVEDITQEIEAEKTKQEQKKLLKESRKAERKSVDVAKITTVKGLLPIIENLIKTVEELEERLG